MKFDVNSKKLVLGSLESPLGGYPLRLNFRSSWALSNVTTWSKIGFVIQKLYHFFFTKLVIKPRGVDLRRKWINPTGEFLYLSFAITRLKNEIIEKKSKIGHWFWTKRLPQPKGAPRGAYLISTNQDATRTYQLPFTLQNRICPCIKKKT